MDTIQPIQVSPINPHYLEYEGKPILLLTSAEHYGAVINLAFDYLAYFDTLASYGLNYTRIYPGSYFEVEGMFIEDNTLAPKPGDLIVPWARSDTPGSAQGGCRFDLDRWDEAYFSRLTDFIEQARKRGIIVEICFFNCQYPQSWPVMPLNAENNLQGFSHGHYNDVQTLSEPALVEAELRYVAEIVHRTAACANVIYEICDEPSLMGTSSAASTAWISVMVDAIVEAERDLPHKHLIAQQVELGVDFTEDSRVPFIVTQYILHNEHRQVGGPEALDCLYLRNKPMEINETAFFPIWYEGDIVAASRAEAWEFMVGGGAGFNQLNGYFTVPNPSGDVPENHAALTQLRVLKEFMYALDFVHLRQDRHFIRGGVPHGAWCRGISNPGEQYALYIHHSILKHGACNYIVTPGEYSEELLLDLPEGCYTAQWIDPASGRLLLSEKFNHASGIRVFSAPAYAVDMALRIDRVMAS